RTECAPPRRLSVDAPPNQHIGIRDPPAKRALRKQQSYSGKCVANIDASWALRVQNQGVAGRDTHPAAVLYVPRSVQTYDETESVLTSPRDLAGSAGGDITRCGCLEDSDHIQLREARIRVKSQRIRAVQHEWTYGIAQGRGEIIQPACL